MWCGIANLQANVLSFSIRLATKRRPIVVTVTWSRTLLQKSHDKDQRSGFGMQQGGRVRPVEPDNIADILHFPLLCNISAQLYLASPPNISNCPPVNAASREVSREDWETSKRIVRSSTGRTEV